MIYTPYIELFSEGIAMLLNPMLVEALVLVETYQNGFVIKHMSESTEMSAEVNNAIEKALQIATEGVPLCNFQKECTREDRNTVKFLCGPKEAYDSSDWDVCISYVSEMIKLLTNARAFVPA